MENKWLDKYNILDPADADGLEINAAQHEFRGGLPREQAEQKAHEQYLKNHALDSAAYHYLGMRAALAAQHQTAAKQHGAAYTLAMKHLGLNPLDRPPQEILERVKDVDKSPYKFSAHKADDFFVPQIPELTEDEKEKAKTQELIDKLKALGKPE